MQFTYSLREEPFTGTARWSARFGLFALPVIVITILLLRQGKIAVEHLQTAVLAGAFIAILAIIFGIAALAIIWVKGWRGTGAALIGIMLGCVSLGFPVWFFAQQIIHPRLYDIATDVGNPPVFEAALSQRDGNDLDIKIFDQKNALLQLSAYPDVQAAELDVDTDEAFGLVKEIIGSRKWHVLATRAPENSDAGIVEVEFRSGILGVVSHAVIRVTPQDSGSRIDIRSASKKWRHDYGVNAAAIRAFMADLRAAAND